MIYYAVRAKHAYTVGTYLEYWEKSFNRQFQILAYEQMIRMPSLPSGSYIFADLEVLPKHQLEIVSHVRDELLKGGMKVLNDPKRVLGRRDLLRLLYERGINTYNVYLVSERIEPERFPVFLRVEKDHQGSRTPLIHNQDDLDQVIYEAIMMGLEPEDLLICEFCETKDEKGNYRKYGAFRIGDKIIARHLLHGTDWLLKVTMRAEDPERLVEEVAFVRDNPHEEQLLKIFDLAGIEYGRIDYAVLDGKVQVWEINTNPTVMSPKHEYNENILPVQINFAKSFRAALEEWDGGTKPTASIPVQFSHEMLERVVLA